METKKPKTYPIGASLTYLEYSVLHKALKNYKQDLLNGAYPAYSDKEVANAVKTTEQVLGKLPTMDFINRELDLEEPKKAAYIKEMLAPFLTKPVPEESLQRLAEWRKMVEFRRSCLQNEYEVEGGVLKYNCASGFNNPSSGFNNPLKITKDHRGESETAIITYKDGRVSILNGVSDRVVAGGEYKHCLVFTKLGLDQLIKLYQQLETSHSNELTFDDRFELKHEIEATVSPIFKWIEERIGLTEKQLQMIYAHGR